MSYIGATQGTSSPVLLDAITVVNNQAAYTMQKSGVNYTPASTLVMQVSLNGIIQAPNSSYTINGSTITFASALVTGDVIDYILVREPTTGTIAPVDSSVTDSKIVSMSSSKLTGALPALDGSALTGVSAGKVLQVVQSYVDTTSSQVISAATPTALTALTVDITPSATNSKIFLFGRLFAETSSTSVANQMVFFYRDTTALRPDTTGLGARPTGLSMVAMGNYGTDAASTPDTTSFFHLDSPATTSQITYKIGYTHNDGGTLYINRSVTDANSTGYERGASVIIAVEIGA